MPPKRLTKYSQDWENNPEYQNWLTSDPNKNEHCAFCKFCTKSFRIDGSGVAQVKSHANSVKHNDALRLHNNNTNQMQFQRDDQGVVSLGNRHGFILNNSEKILKAEILWALKCVYNNFSFASNEGCSQLFEEMFPDSVIAKGYQMSATKIKYMIEFGISPYLIESQLSDLHGKAYTLSFDETTTSQVRKQCDVYVHYYSKKTNNIQLSYLTSVFTGHCTSNDLLKHFLDIKNEKCLDVQLLLHIGMDGPNTNLSFHKKLEEHLKNTNNKKLLNVGTCNLHPLHNGFLKGLEKISFDFDSFVQDVHFFFKYSSGRREDFDVVSSITDIETEHMLRHVNSRWLSLKKVLSRILKQWANLKEYFLKQLPKEKGFSQNVGNTNRYQRIQNILKDSKSPVYMAFATHVAELVEFFLLRFQSSRPLITYLYTSFGEVLYNLMRQFILKELLEEDKDGKTVRKDAAQLAKVDIDAFNNRIPIMNIEIGVQAVKFLHEIKISEIDEKAVRIEFRKCYVEIVNYLKRKFPIDNTFIKDVQYLNPSNDYRFSKKSTGAITRLAMTLGNVLKGNIRTCFETCEEISSESLGDKVRLQWQLYQIDNTIDESWYSTEKNSNGSEKHIRQDDYWNKVLTIKNIEGKCKYKQLCLMALICLTISHGNANAERGFSLNKFALDSRTSLQESTIIAIRTIKDVLKRYESVSNFPMSSRLLQIVATSKQKYVQYLEAKKLLEERKLNQRREEKERKEVEQKKRKFEEELDEINDLIITKKAQLNIAQDIIAEGNDLLNSAMLARTLRKEDLVMAQTKIALGLKQTDSTTSELENLYQRRQDCDTKISALKKKKQ